MVESFLIVFGILMACLVFFLLTTIGIVFIIFVLNDFKNKNKKKKYNIF